jgi:hypothetical protein
MKKQNIEKARLETVFECNEKNTKSACAVEIKRNRFLQFNQQSIIYFQLSNGIKRKIKKLPNYFKFRTLTQLVIYLLIENLQTRKGKNTKRMGRRNPNKNLIFLNRQATKEPSDSSSQSLGLTRSAKAGYLNINIDPLSRHAYWPFQQRILTSPDLQEAEVNHQPCPP